METIYPLIMEEKKGFFKGQSCAGGGSTANVRKGREREGMDGRNEDGGGRKGKQAKGDGETRTE
ncbi:hypothetical protein D3C87_2065930 [compost metagenome]